MGLLSGHLLKKDNGHLPTLPTWGRDEHPEARG